MAERLTTYAWKHSRRDQIIVFLVTLLTFPTIYISLELPKMIINDAISSEDFPRTFLSFELTQLHYLFMLCGAYLVAIAVNNGLKFYLNFSRGVMGERMLRRMRFDVFTRVMGRRLNRLRSTSPGELVQMISAELAPIGDFVGAIFATPLLQGGSFLVFLGFIIVQNTYIGIAALSLYPVQAYVIPKLQAKVVEMITRRLINLRAIAREISESVDGATEVRSLRTSRWHTAIVSDKLYENYLIRRRIFILKNLIKFTNNVADHLTPFLIFLIGGYFVIEGQLNVGALTAVLMAYKDLSSPWRELLTYYQDFSDMSARFRNVMSQFEDDSAAPEDAPAHRKGEHAVQLSGATFEGLDVAVNCHVPMGSVTIVLSDNDTSRSALMQAMAGVLDLDAGSWLVGEDNPLRMPVLVSADTRVFTGSVRYNILHGLHSYPVTAATDEQSSWRKREAQLTGSTTDDARAGWVDPQALGYDGDTAITERLMALVRRFDFEDDLYQIGLGSHINPDLRPDLAEGVLRMRRAIADDPDLSRRRDEFIDIWSEDRFNPHGSLGENIFFARPAGPSPSWRALAADPAITRALDSAGIRTLLVEIGIDICKTLLSLFEGVDDQSELFSRYGMFPKSETPVIENILSKVARRGADKLSRGEKARLVGIALDYGAARYRLRLIREKERDVPILAARKKLRKQGFADLRLSTFDPDRYVASLNLSENIFFGPVRQDRRDAWGTFAAEVDALATVREMREAIVAAGLEQPIGDGGVSLNAAQRRKIALVRALLKRPVSLILDGVHGSASESDGAIRKSLHEELGGGALVFAGGSFETYPDVGHVIVLEDGRHPNLSEGPPEDLMPNSIVRTATGKER